MIKQNIEKIARLLKDKTYSVPQLFYKFYAFVMAYAEKIVSQGAQQNAIALYSDVFHLFRSFLVDQPFHLTKLTIDKIFDMENQPIGPLLNLIMIRDRFIKEFAKYQPKDQSTKVIVQQMNNFCWASNLKAYNLQSLSIKKSIQEKKKHNQGPKYSEITILCWYKQYKNEYLVHIDNFMEYFQKFVKQCFPSLNFITNQSISYLKSLCDSEKKYFITISNCEELFQKIRQPLVLKKILQQSHHQHQEQPFKSQHSMNVMICNANSNELQRFQITGESIVTNNQQKSLKYKPVISFGSSTDNDIVIKSKYVSRKQLMIVEDKINKQPKQKQNLTYFSLVCLSQSNFTTFKYPTAFKINVGAIFYCQDAKYQVLKINKQSMDIQVQQDERTLTILPTERQSTNNMNISCQRITFLILSGQDKEKQVSLSSQSFKKMSEIEMSHEYYLAKQIIYLDAFYLKEGTKILVKTANEIIENRISKKLKLVKNIQICLDECTLTIQ